MDSSGLLSGVVGFPGVFVVGIAGLLIGDGGFLASVTLLSVPWLPSNALTAVLDGAGVGGFCREPIMTDAAEPGGARGFGLATGVGTSPGAGNGVT